MEALGIYGGTFDPVHAGHIEIAEIAYAQHGLNKVLLIPANNPWLKTGLKVSKFVHRYRMLEIATSCRTGLEVSDIEGRRQGPTYTIDTVLQLQRTYSEVELVLILGEDAVEALPRWHRVDELMKLCLVSVYRRSSANTTENAEEIISSLGGHMAWLHGPDLDISATELRSLIAAGVDPLEKLPRGVYPYLQTERLYLL